MCSTCSRVEQAAVLPEVLGIRKRAEMSPDELERRRGAGIPTNPLPRRWRPGPAHDSCPRMVDVPSEGDVPTRERVRQGSDKIILVHRSKSDPCR